MPLDAPGAPTDGPTVARLRLPIDVRNVSLAILALLAIVFSLKFAADALIPVTLAVFLGYALMPFVLWLKRRARVPEALGALLALILVIGTIGLGAALVQPQVTRLIDAVPQATQKLKVVLHRTALDRNSAVRRLTIAADEIQKAASSSSAADAGDPEQLAGNSPIKLRDYLWSGTAALVGGLAEAVIVLALSYFLLISGHDFKRKLVRISGSSLRRKKLTVQILEEIDVQVQRYLLIQFGTSALVGVLTGAAFAVIGLENALFWGVASAVLHLIPYIGSALVIGAAAIFAYLQFSGLHEVLLVVGSALVIVWIVGLGLVPWMTQRMASMNAVATFVSLILWNWLWGIPGLLLGVPIMMAVMAVCERLETLKPIAELLNAEAPRTAVVVAASP